ncbi:hypothetical protein HZP23_16480 [Elizabethkingia anophelis]|nr:hypothetical protein [Elizabethkingia anophelis]MCT4302438.1 hypothetical protein [Elizabethkingia anophelis]
MGTCKLCNKEKKLIEAHIIPKFLYKNMKDTKKNTFLLVEYKSIDPKKKMKRIVQKEVYDKNILCSDCDNAIFGEGYESYVKRMLYDSNCEIITKPQLINVNSNMTYCLDFDYKKIKNFLLSILWRASITDQPFFSEINLGDKHNESLRQILYNNLQTDYKEYPILITSFLKTKNKFDKTILKPYKTKDSGLVTYIFFINGLQFIFFVNSYNHKLPDKFEKYLLKEKEIPILHLKDGMEKYIIKSLFSKTK